MQKHIVLKHPSADTLSIRQYIDDDQEMSDGWEEMSEEQYVEWEEQELLTWVKPTPTITPPPTFLVTPENFRLACSLEDETEFSKLLSLCQLGLSKNILNTSSILNIKDASGQTHSVTVERFLDIIIAYGMFCYQIRNF